MKSRIPMLLVVLMFCSALLVACGGGGDTGGGAAAEGKTLFAEQVVGAQPGCITCHSLEAETVLVGPPMAGIGSRAGSSVSGVSAEDYLRQSILDPDAHVVEGYDPGVMVQVWEEELTAEQIDNLIAYMLTLK